MAFIPGTGGDDTLDGTAVDDVINGGAGADTMTGGTGDDSYYVDNPGDLVIETAGQGIDSILTSVNVTLTASQEIEYLRVFATLAGLALTGNGLDNILIGGTGGDTLNGGGGDDRLKGGAGADALAGGTGNDSYYIDDAGDTVTETTGQGADEILTSVNFTLTASQEIETLRVYVTAAGLTLTGNGLDNYIIGGAGNDTLNGGGGGDRLNGGAGADIIAGGAGNDTYYLDDAGDTVTETAGQGTDTILTSANLTLTATQEIESLRVYNTAAGLTLTGNGFDNEIIGGAGGDTLSGGGGADRLNGDLGADTMAGGTGDDTYFVDDAGDVVNEDAGGGNDTVYTNVSYNLAAGQEVEAVRIFGGATGLLLRGNDRDNALFGSTGDDTLESGAGNDQLHGGDGNDIISTMGASAIIYGGGGDDSIRLDEGSSGSTGEVFGGAGHDTVHSTNLGQYTFHGVETFDTYFGFSTATIAQIASFDNYTAVLADSDMQISLSLRGAGGTLDFTAGISGQNSVEIRDAGLTSAITITGSVNGDLMFGTSFGDTFKGGNGNDTLLGGDGDDTLEGGAGNDLLNAGRGSDTVTGGAGDDIFRFDSPFGVGTGVSLLADFTPGSDTIEIDRTNYFQGFALGQLAAAGFSSGAATGAGPQIVYDQATGALFYDSNGAGDGGASRFATLASKPTLTAADFTIIEPAP